MRGSGGTEGGTGQFLLGFCLSVLGLYLFFDSVQVTTGPFGVFSGWMGRGHGGAWQTTSMGILFVPFFLGVMFLFYDARPRWAWALMWIGLAVIVIEILSRVRFLMAVKTSHLLGMFVLFGAGAGLMLRSYRDGAADSLPPPGDSKGDSAEPEP